MKKALLILLAIIILLSGCEKRYDINERLIVQAVGIDYSSSGFEVTVQTLNTDSYSGIGGAKVPEKLVRNYYLTGKTVADALAKLSSTAGKRPLFTHTRIVLIGKELAKRGLKHLIDYFTRDPDCHAGLLVAVCEEAARQTLVANESKESVPAVEIENIIKTSGKSPNTVSVRIFELVKMYREKTTSVYLPVVSVTKEGTTDKTVKVLKTAVFRGDRLTDYIDYNDTENLSIFTNNVITGTYTLENSKYGNVSFDFYSSRCKTDVLTDANGGILFKVRIKCVFDCAEFTGAENDESDKKTISEVENSIENQISKNMESFLNTMCRQGTDCMRLGRILLLKNQNLYKQCENDWEDTLKRIKITVTAKVTVRRTGQESGL